MLCTGNFYPEWIEEKPPFPFNELIFVLCSILQIIFTIFIGWAKFKWKSNENHNLSANQKNSTNFGGMVTTWITLFIILYATVSVIAQNQTSPWKLREYPWKILVLNHQMFSPTIVPLAANILFFFRNKKLRIAAKRIFMPVRIHTVNV